MEPISLYDFMEAAERAMQKRLTLVWLEAFRAHLDLVAKRDEQRATRENKAGVEALFRQLMDMDIPFSERSFEIATRDEAKRRLYMLLVARYISRRAEIARKAHKYGWLCPPVGGQGQKEFDESCLMHLMYPIKNRAVRR